MRLDHALLAGTALLTPACGSDSDSNSDNGSWVVVSNPSGSPGKQNGGLIVIIRLMETPSATDPQRWIGVAGTDRRGPVRVRMLTQGDLVLLEYGDRIDVLDPRLPNGSWSASEPSIEVPDAGPLAFALAVPDTRAVHPAARGSGRLVAAAFGSLLVLEHELGLVVFGAEPQPRVLPRHRLQVTESEFRAVAPDLTVQVLREPTAAPVEERMQHDARRGSLTIRGPFGETLAEVPETAVAVSDGADGLLFRAELPQGLGRGDREPFVLLGPRHNRYVLRIDG